MAKGGWGGLKSVAPWSGAKRLQKYSGAKGSFATNTPINDRTRFMATTIGAERTSSGTDAWEREVVTFFKRR